MGYGTKYYTSGFGDISGNTFVVNLKLRNYSGTSTEIKYGDVSPLMINYLGGRGQVDIRIRGSQCQFNFYCEQGKNYDDILEAETQDWQIVVTKNGATYWVGWVVQDNLTRNFITPSYMINLSATDGLADLSNIDYPYLPSTGSTTYLQLIKNCLSQTNINLPIKCQMNIYENHLSGKTQFDKILANQLAFVAISSGKITYTNCGDALDQLLNAFNCYVVQSNGYYIITQANEISSPSLTYNWLNLTGSTPTLFNRQLDISTTLVKPDTDELSKIRPFVGLDLTFHQQDAGRIQDPNELNSYFKYDVSGWSNGLSSAAYYSVDWDSGTTRMQVLAPYFLPPYGDQSPKYVESNTFQLNSSSGSTITVTCLAEITYISFTGASAGSPSYPILRLELIDFNGIAVSHVDMTYPPSGTSELFIETLTYQATGLHTLRVWMRPSTSFINQVIVEYDDITVFKNNDSTVATQTLYEGLVNNSTAIQMDAQDLYFGDSKSLYDQAALMWKPSGLTSQWNNYGDNSQFGNLSFTAGTLAPWFADGSNGGQAWSYLGGLSNDVNAFSTSTLFSGYILQGNFQAGNYRIKSTFKNTSTIVGGMSANHEFVIVGKSIATGAFTNLGQITVTSGAGYVSTIFNVSILEPSYLGFYAYAFGTATQLNAWCSDMSILSTNANINIPLSNLLIKNKLNLSYKFRDYLRFTIKDTTKLAMNNVLKINSKIYDIVALSCDLKNSWSDIELVEHPTGSTITTTITTTKLTN